MSSAASARRSSATGRRRSSSAYAAATRAAWRRPPGVRRTRTERRSAGLAARSISPRRSRRSSTPVSVEGRCAVAATSARTVVSASMQAGPPHHPAEVRRQRTTNEDSATPRECVAQARREIVHGRGQRRVVEHRQRVEEEVRPAGRVREPRPHALAPVPAPACHADRIGPDDLTRLRRIAAVERLATRREHQPDRAHHAVEVLPAHRDRPLHADRVVEVDEPVDRRELVRTPDQRVRGAGIPLGAERTERLTPGQQVRVVRSRELDRHGPRGTIDQPRSDDHPRPVTRERLPDRVRELQDDGQSASCW